MNLQNPFANITPSDSQPHSMPVDKISHKIMHIDYLNRELFNLTRKIFQTSFMGKVPDLKIPELREFENNIKDALYQIIDGIK